MQKLGTSSSSAAYLEMWFMGDVNGWNYPDKPIGGGNPYYQCLYCGRSAPEINGDINGHYDFCKWAEAAKKGIDIGYPID